MEILPAFTQAGDKKAAVKFNKRFKERIRKRRRDKKYGREKEGKKKPGR
ncbi:MAG: hypothetical protein Q4C69_06470 [Lachnoclostridium edouardi]|nr:hypothetical protein [Lachnoclostridium edouardi]MDO4278453.1 hypothetical protein [Lachnoclostridium edouardi]